MDDLIGRLVVKAGVDRADASQVVGFVRQPLLKQFPTDEVRAPIRSMPGADAAMSALNARSPSGMRAGIAMMAALGSSPIQALARESMSFALEQAGEHAVGDIVGAVPGLGHLV